MRTLLALALLGSASTFGCGVPGSCDEDAARDIVHQTAPGTSLDGLPAYAGQALMIRSCGYGSFCHSGGAVAEARRGAPVGLNFDVRLASRDARVGDEARLDEDQRRTALMGGSIWQQISTGAMPPGRTGDEVVASEDTPEYVHVDLALGTVDPLPGLDTDAGREIIRNWLACGAPIIERAEARGDGAPNRLGVTAPRADIPRPCASVEQCDAAVPRCDVAAGVCRGCGEDTDCAHLAETPLCDARSGSCFRLAEPTFSSIHEVVVTRGCATGLCHVETDRAPAGRLDMADRTEAYTNLIDVPADGSIFCRPTGLARVAPGDPDASLLYLKLAGGEVCGEHMPQGGDPLPARQVDAIREWITNGAAND